MADDPVTDDWRHLLQVAVFELRSPLSVAVGYSRMLHSERIGPLTETQQQCVKGALGALKEIQQVAETVDALSRPESSVQSIEAIPSQSLLAQILAELPSHFIENFGPFDLRVVAANDEVMGSPLIAEGFRRAVTGVCKELTRSDQPYSIWIVDPPEVSERWIVIAASDQIQEAATCLRGRLVPLAERKSRFLDFPVAGRIARAHGGQLLALPEGLSGAVIALQRPPF